MQIPLDLFDQVLTVIPLVTTTFYLSKDQLWVYDQIPEGRSRLLNSKTLQTMLILIPMPLFYWVLSLIPLFFVNLKHKRYNLK